MQHLYTAFFSILYPRIIVASGGTARLVLLQYLAQCITFTSVFHVQFFRHFDFPQLTLWNSQEPAEHLGLPGVAVLEHDGAELHHLLLLDMEEIVHPDHQGWR